MKKFLRTLAVLPVGALLVLAQDTPAPGSTKSQSWTGTLVAAACSTSGSSIEKGSAEAAMPRGTSSPGREQNSTYEDRAKQADRSSTASSRSKTDATARRTDRGASVDQATPALTEAVTTPPVDDKGTRGSATKNTPPTGVKDQSNAADRSKAGNTAAGDMAADHNGLDRSCYIGQNTNAFALRLKDGRMVRLDDPSNQKVVQQLKSGDRLQDKVKTFRATVKGTMQADTITVESIKM